jgi:hypothetical protein
MCNLLDELNLADALISDLSQSLDTFNREIFRQEATELMARLAVLGPGAAYRLLAPLQARYFTPPTDQRAGYDVVRADGVRRSKLFAKPAIGRDYGPGRSLR